MRFVLSAILAILAVSPLSTAQTVHSFDSGGMAKATSGVISVPGATAVPTSVTLTLTTDRAVGIYAENTAASVNTFFGFSQPWVTVHGDFNITSDLPVALGGASFPSYDGVTDFAGTSGGSWQSGTDGKTLTLTITDPAILAGYVGGKVDIPLSMTAGYSASWTGAGTSRVETSYHWYGTVAYN